MTRRRNNEIRELPRQKPERENATATITCDSALRDAGINEALIAKKLKEQLEAKQAAWNSNKKAFELFPDYNARLAALREVVKIFGGYPSESDGGGGPVMLDLGPLTPKQF